MVPGGRLAQQRPGAPRRASPGVCHVSAVTCGVSLVHGGGALARFLPGLPRVEAPAPGPGVNILQKTRNSRSTIFGSK